MAFVLKICGSSWENASRDKRELSVYRDLGNRVEVLAKGNPDDKGRVDEVDGFKVYRMSTRPLGIRVPNAINRVVSLFSWAKFARKLKPDVITGHDLLPGLTISWMVTLFNKNKPILIYDSHEFEIGRTAKGSMLEVKLITIWEKFLMDKCVYTIVVNESIRDEIIRIHHPKTRLVVVRNIPYKWDVDDSVCNEVRQKILADSVKGGYILMYHGAISYGRGIEKCVDVLESDDDLLLTIMGPCSNDKYLDELKLYISQKEMSDRVFFLDAVPQEDLWKWIGAADAEMVVIEAVGRSYYLSLPNKLFESIQARVPVIASDFPEISKIVSKYKVGLTVDSSSVNDIVEKVKYLKENKSLQNSIRQNERLASEELNWENEKLVLEEAFSWLQ